MTNTVLYIHNLDAELGDDDRRPLPPEASLNVQGSSSRQSFLDKSLGPLDEHASPPAYLRRRKNTTSARIVPASSMRSVHDLSS